MNLLHIIPSLDPSGGGPIEAARCIHSQMNRIKVFFEVACLDAPSQPFFRDYPATIHALGPTVLSYRYCLKLIPWMRDNYKRFDAVIIDGLWQYHGFAAWRVLSGTDTPYFVFTHGMLDPWFKHAYPLKHLKKWLYWPWAEYRILRDARAVLFTCDEERRLARNSFWLHRSHEIVVPLGTDFPPHDEEGKLSAIFRNAHPALREKRLLLYLGRIHEKKGCDLLIQAFAQVARDHADQHLVMAGPDQTGWTPTLKRQALALGVQDRITWTGMLLGEHKWGAFHAAEVFCLPSHQENFGIAVVEALGCGKPVLISDKVNIWREIEADGAGIVQPDTLEGTIKALRTWLTLKPEDRVRMSQAAHACFNTRYRIEQTAQNLASVIKSHINQTPAITTATSL